MDIFAQILKLIFRIRYWLIFLPLFAAIIVIYQTRNLQREYIVNTTIYTGIASGFTIESGVEEVELTGGALIMDWIILLVLSNPNQLLEMFLYGYMYNI